LQDPTKIVQGVPPSPNIHAQRSLSPIARRQQEQLLARGVPFVSGIGGSKRSKVPVSGAGPLPGSVSVEPSRQRPASQEQGGKDLARSLRSRSDSRPKMQPAKSQDTLAASSTRVPINRSAGSAKTPGVALSSGGLATHKEEQEAPAQLGEVSLSSVKKSQLGVLVSSLSTGQLLGGTAPPSNNFGQRRSPTNVTRDLVQTLETAKQAKPMQQAPAQAKVAPSRSPGAEHRYINPGIAMSYPMGVPHGGRTQTANMQPTWGAAPAAWPAGVSSPAPRAPTIRGVPGCSSPTVPSVVSGVARH